MNEFGFELKEARIKKGLTLRGFCLSNGFDPGNQSRYERGVLPPPQDPVIVVRWLKAMGYTEGEIQWKCVLQAAVVEIGNRAQQDYDKYILE